MSEKIRLVLPDAGPLITLAQADALEVLLVFDAAQVQLVATDMVAFEVTRRRSTHADAQRIADFIDRHAGRIVVEETSFGRMAIAAAQTYERYVGSAQVRDFYAAQGMPAPMRPAPNSGEMSIVSYVSELIGRPPGPACLVIAEDDFFLRANPGALPGNAHIISTGRLLARIEEIDPRVRARSVLDAAAAVAGREPNRAVVDVPAAKVKGGTRWSDTLDATEMPAPRGRARGKSSRGPAGKSR